MWDANGRAVNGAIGAGLSLTGGTLSAIGGDYLTLTAGYPTDGSGVTERTIFRGTDNALYYKGTSTVTKLADA
jgi:hypothetical protein